MEELRKEYEGLGLDDSQIVQAKSLGLTPEQIKNIIESLKQMTIELNKIFVYITTALRGFASSDEGKKLIELLNKPADSKLQVNRNKKGKKLKPWENKKFYQ